MHYYLIMPSSLSHHYCLPTPHHHQQQQCHPPTYHLQWNQSNLLSHHLLLWHLLVKSHSGVISLDQNLSPMWRRNWRWSWRGTSEDTQRRVIPTAQFVDQSRKKEMICQLMIRRRDEDEESGTKWLQRSAETRERRRLRSCTARARLFRCRMQSSKMISSAWRLSIG